MLPHQLVNLEERARIGNAEAQFTLAKLLLEGGQFEGYAIAPDPQRAAMLLKRAAQQQQADAIALLHQLSATAESRRRYWWVGTLLCAVTATLIWYLNR